jgi:hypothetical protein
MSSTSPPAHRPRIVWWCVIAIGPGVLAQVLDGHQSEHINVQENGEHSF